MKHAERCKRPKPCHGESVYDDLPIPTISNVTVDPKATGTITFSATNKEEDWTTTDKAGAIKLCPSCGGKVTATNETLCYYCWAKK